MCKRIYTIGTCRLVFCCLKVWYLICTSMNKKKRIILMQLIGERLIINGSKVPFFVLRGIGDKLIIYFKQRMWKLESLECSFHLFQMLQIYASLHFHHFPIIVTIVECRIVPLRNGSSQNHPCWQMYIFNFPSSTIIKYSILLIRCSSIYFSFFSISPYHRHFL